MVEAHFITGETDSPIFRGFVVLTRFVFAYNALLLIIPSPSIDFHVFTYKKTDKDSRWSEHVPVGYIVKNFLFFKRDMIEHSFLERYTLPLLQTCPR